MLDQEKLFYQRFWALHDDPVLVEVFKRFGPEPFRRSSVLEGFAAFLKSSGLRGHRCLEIGSWKGLTALVLARCFDQVVSVDVVADPQREIIAAHCGVKNVQFLTVADNAQKARLIEGLAFDAAYVDGDHMRDTQGDFDLVRSCGRVLFHEYWEAQPAVWELVNALRASGTVTVAGKFALWTN